MSINPDIELLKHILDEAKFILDGNGHTDAGVDETR